MRDEGEFGYYRAGEKGVKPSVRQKRARSELALARLVVTASDNHKTGARTERTGGRDNALCWALIGRRFRTKIFSR